MKLYVELENQGSEVTQMVGGLDYKLKTGINWLPKAVAEFITTKLGEVKIVSSPIECDEAGIPLSKVSAVKELKTPETNETLEDEEPPVGTGNEPVVDEELDKLLDQALTDKTDSTTKLSDEEVENYKKELEEMTLPELKKILTVKDIKFRPQANKKEAIKLIMLNIQ